MKVNTWLAGYIVAAVILIGGAGFYFFQGLSAYGRNFSGWDSLAGKISNLEKKVPYPKEENEEALRKLVEGYDGEVKGLYDSLARYQRPFDTNITDTAFTTQVLAKKVEEFLKTASESQFQIDEKEQFFMAMEEYQSAIPKPEVVPLLNYQLEAIDHLLRTMVDSGIERLNLVSRDSLPLEVAAADAAPAALKVVEKYPLRVRFVADHPSFQEFVNRVSNDKEYFFIIRVLRVENSSPTGPVLDAGDEGPGFKDINGNPPPQELVDQLRSTATSTEEMISQMAEKGYTMQREDARIIFGQEKLEVFAVIDLVQFRSPEEVSASVEADAESGRSGRRRE